MSRHRRQSAKHVGVSRIATGGKQNAFVGVDLHIAVFGREDSSGHSTVFVSNEALQGVAVGDFFAVIVYELLEDLVALFNVAATFGVAIVMFKRGGIVVGTTHTTRHFEFVSNNNSTGSAHKAVNEFKHVVGLIHPHTDETLVAVALRIANDFAHEALAINFGTNLSERTGAQSGEPVTSATNHFGLFARNEVNALVGSVSGSSHAAIAGANNQQVAVTRFDNIGFVDLGSGAQPVDSFFTILSSRKLIGLSYTWGCDTGNSQHCQRACAGGCS